MQQSVFEVIGQDLRLGLRRLWRRPGFALTAILSLALGIGANTAVFRVIDAIQLRSLPVLNPRELVQLKIAGGTRGFGISLHPAANATWPIWQEIERRQQAFSGVFAWSSNDVRLGEATDERLIRGLWLSAQTFRVLGLHPIRGRMFDSGGSCELNAALISHDFWISHFAGKESALGSRIVVNDRPVSIIGVAPPKFFGLEVGKGFDIAQPICARIAEDSRLNERDRWWLIVMARLRPGVALTAADSQARTMSEGLFEAVTPGGYDAEAMKVWRQFRLTAIPAPAGISSLREHYGSSLWFVLAIAGMILVIACSNVANLMLAQAGAREGEVALQLALGIRRTRLVAQLLNESVLLAVLATGAGSLLGWALSSLLGARLRTSHSVVQLDLAEDWRLFAFMAVLTLVVCCILGTAPLLRLLRKDVIEAIKRGGKGGLRHSRASVFQRLMIGSQLALSLFLLVTAVSLVRSFRSLATLDTGFRTEGLDFCFIDFSRLRMAEGRMRAFRAELLENFRRTPGVDSASATTHLPLSGNSWTLGVSGARGNQRQSVRFDWVTGAYFRTLGSPLLQGRNFDERDSSGSRRVLIVNETFARRLGSGLGTLVRSAAEPGYPATSYEIIGVVRDAKYDSLREDIPPVAYAPDDQNPAPGPWIAVVFRASAPTTKVVGAVAGALMAKYPSVRMHFEELQPAIDESLARERMLALLSGLFGALAAVLTAVGLYGVIAYIVSLRRSEIAIRAALGATPLRIVLLVTGNTAVVAAAGISAGLALSFVGARFLTSLLFGLRPNDPLTLVSAASGLIAIGILASAWPAFKSAFILNGS